MTDKQIIIDGVDVITCSERGETISGITCGNGSKIRLADRYIYKYKLCKDNPNCLFKQLARKTQECEELKNNFSIEHAELLNARSEIEKLKKQIESDKGLITNAGKQNYRLIQEYDRLKTALTEIKWIAEQILDDDDNHCPFELTKQILNKISEVE